MNGTNRTATEPLPAEPEVVGEKVDGVMDAASTASSRARDQALDIANKRKGPVLEPAKNLAGETSRIADQLRERGQEKPADVLNTVSREVNNLISYVESNNVEQILDDVSERARRQPLVFVGAAFVLGFATSRLLKAKPTVVRTEGGR